MDIQLKLFDLIEYKPATMRFLKSTFKLFSDKPEYLQEVYGRSDKPPTTSIKTHNYNWYYWRAYALKRDNGICQGSKCGKPANEVHHILPKSRGGSDHPDNLISLCTSCHCEVDAWRSGWFS